MSDISEFKLGGITHLQMGRNHKKKQITSNNAMLYFSMESHSLVLCSTCTSWSPNA